LLKKTVTARNAWTGFFLILSYSVLVVREEEASLDYLQSLLLLFDKTFLFADSFHDQIPPKDSFCGDLSS
jgi:hypothetical protein